MNNPDKKRLLLILLQKMRKSSLPFFPLCHPSYVWLNDSRDIPALNNQTFARCYLSDVYSGLTHFTYLFCFSQNFIALSIQPSATVPCPSPKPCPKPRKTSICASVPFALIAFMRRSIVLKEAIPSFVPKQL